MSACEGHLVDTILDPEISFSLSLSFCIHHICDIGIFFVIVVAVVFVVMAITVVFT